MLIWIFNYWSLMVELYLWHVLMYCKFKQCCLRRVQRYILLHIRLLVRYVGNPSISHQWLRTLWKNQRSQFFLNVVRLHSWKFFSGDGHPYGKGEVYSVVTFHFSFFFSFTIKQDILVTLMIISSSPQFLKFIVYIVFKLVL